MTVRRTFSAAFLNAVANDAEVRPHLSGSGEVDLTRLVANPENVALVVDGSGGFVLQRLGEGLYEAHSLFLPGHHGRTAMDAMVEGVRYMFAATDCVEIVSRVPDHNHAARGLAREAGLREVFRLEHDPRSGWPVSVQQIDLDRWRARDSACARAGVALHDMLKEAGRHDGHAEDEAHDRAAGAAVLMCQAGQPAKAAWTYNRWAMIAGYGPIAVLNASPLVVDIGTARVAMFGDGRMEVM